MMGSCLFAKNAEALPIGRFGVESVTSSGSNYFINLNWRTSVDRYSAISYGITEDLGTTTRLTYPGSDMTTDHHLSVPNLPSDAERYIQLGAYDADGNPDTPTSTFLVRVGAPYLESIDSETTDCTGNENCLCADGICTFGPESDINIKATFSEAIDTATMSVRLNTDNGNPAKDIALTSINGAVLSGTYTVGATSGTNPNQNVNDLDVLSIIAGQNVCDAEVNCVDNEVLPPPDNNLGELRNIRIDTTPPDISSFEPENDSYINNVTNNSPISYELNEALKSGSIVFKIGESVDATCELTGAALSTVGELVTIDLSDTTDGCTQNISGLLDSGEVYSITISGEDFYGNSSSEIIHTNITFDTDSPSLDSFSSTSSDAAYYDAGDTINVTANFDEDVRDDSEMVVILNTGASVTLSTVDGQTISGVYTVGVRTSGQKTQDLTVSSISSHTIYDLAGNLSPSVSMPGDGNNIAFSKNIIVDTLGYNIQYYANSELTSSLNDNPHLKDGTYYIKITSTDTMTGVPSVTIAAEGSANDVTNTSAEAVSGNVYKLTRTISEDALAVGVVKEAITISGANSLGHSKTGIHPENEGSKVAYTDTTPPEISNVDADTLIGSGNFEVTLNFDEVISSSVEFAVSLTKSGGGSLDIEFDNELAGVSGSTWTGSVTVNEGSDGEWILKVLGVADLAGNVMADNNNAETITVDTSDPTYTVVDGTSANVVRSDTINITTADPGAGMAYQYYGYSVNSTCDGNDTIDSAFTSGEDFIIGIGGDVSQNHLYDYLCIKIADNAENVVYALVGQLRVDFVAPTITSIYAIPSPGSDTINSSYNAGETIYLRINFSEDVITLGEDELTVFFEAGDDDPSCSFSMSESAAYSEDCSFVVTTSHQTDRLQAISPIMGTAYDFLGGNELIKTIAAEDNFPDQNISLDSLAPVLNSFTAEPASGVFGPGGEIVITASYGEDLGDGSSIDIILSNGASVSLDNISGTTLYGTYTVGETGSGQTTQNLSVASISSQHAVDLDENVQNFTGSYSGSNLSAGINIDTTAPIFSDVSPTESSNINSLTTDSDISYSISENLADDETAMIQFIATVGGQIMGEDKTCILNGSALIAGAHNDFDTRNCKNLSETGIELMEGAMYTVNFVGYDNYGNESDFTPIENVSYGFDENDPEISNCVISDLTFSSVKISWFTSENSDAFVDYGTTTSYGKTVGDGSISEESGTSHSITLYDLNAATQYYFRMRSSDSNNNEGVSNICGEGLATFTTPVDSTDSVAPNISDVEVPEEYLTSNSAKITWNTDESADSYVAYGETDEYGEIFGSYSMLQSHSVVLPSDLEPETTYHYQVISRDASGNEARSDDDSFVTTAATDGNGEGEGSLVVSNVKVSVGDIPNSMIVTWTTNENANGMVRYGLDNEYGQTAAEDLTVDSKTSFSTDHSVVLKDLLSNSTYNYKVVSYDQYGNIAFSENKTFSTATLQLVSEPKVTNASTKSVVIIWETIDPSFTGLEYGTTTSYGKSSQDAVLANLHRVELTGLQAGQVYHFKIKGGKSSDLVYSKDYLFGTFGKPTVSGFSVDEITDNSAVVKWDSSVPSESYVEYQNLDDPEDKGTQGNSGLLTDNQVVLNSLKQGSKYTVKIKGIDVNKNDFESTEINFETLIDTTPPEISQVSTDSSLVTGKEDKVQTIVSWKTDEPATSQVTFDIGGSNEGELGQKSKEDPNLTTNHLVVLTNLRSGTVYHFKVISKDKNSNQKESQDFTLLTPQKKQSVIQMIIANFEQSFGWLKKLKN